MDEWQTKTTSNSNKQKPKRAFVGNLTPSTNLETKLKELFLKSNITIQKLNIIKPKVGTNCFALVDCDVDEAIKCLDGISFQGNRIVVQKEKKQNKSSSGGGGGSKFGGGWAKPKQRNRTKNLVDSAPSEQNQNGTSKTLEISQIASQATNEHQTNNTSAVGTYSIANDDFMSKLSLNGTSSKNKVKDEIQSFHERCNLNINQLMEEYGDHDPNFENMKVDLSLNTSSNQPPTNNHSTTLSSLPPSTRNSDNKEKSSESYYNTDSGMLAPNGSAPIDVELVSFGYKYSVPPQARQGWSHSNPLSPIDCRNLPRCPHYVAKLSGLSYKVKKAFLSKDYYLDAKNSRSEGGDDDIGNNGETNDDDEDVQNRDNDDNTTLTNPLVAQSNQIAQTILKAIEEAINDGNHGYAFPLQAIVFIGSEYGRHRSVVLCENVATNTRKLLRVNEGDRIAVPVSICVRHRDVDKQHRDGEAFGDDLRRAHEAEVKRKKKQEWLENRNGNDYW